MLHSSLSLIWASLSQARMLKLLRADPTCPPATLGIQTPSSHSLGLRHWTIGTWSGQSHVSWPVCWSVCKIYSTYVVFSDKLYGGWMVMSKGSQQQAPPSPVCEPEAGKKRACVWSNGSEGHMLEAHSTLFHEEYSLSFCKEYISI